MFKEPFQRSPIDREFLVDQIHHDNIFSNFDPNEWNQADQRS